MNDVEVEFCELRTDGVLRSSAKTPSRNFARVGFSEVYALRQPKRTQASQRRLFALAEALWRQTQQIGTYAKLHAQ
jgi:hypothetical protein